MEMLIEIRIPGTLKDQAMRRSNCGGCKYPNLGFEAWMGGGPMYEFKVYVLRFRVSGLGSGFIVHSSSTSCLHSGSRCPGGCSSPDAIKGAL